MSGMLKYHNIIRIVGTTWIKIAFVIVILLYLFNLIFSEAPVTVRILSLINIWNIFIAFLIILPGCILTEFANWLENKNKKEKPHNVALESTRKR